MVFHQPEPLAEYNAGPIQHHFDPYADNGGSVVAIAGDNFSVIASDTRLTQGYGILTRDQSKLFKMTGSTVLASTGCWCDCQTFNRRLQIQLKMYAYDHQNEMSTKAVAQYASTMLYGRRFFPYYVWNVLAGLDDEGKGCVYSYDPVGHMEKVPYASGGSSNSLILPFLDNIVGKKNQEISDPTPLTKEKAVVLIKDIFFSAAERDTNCGDAVHLCVITKDGIEEHRAELRKD